VKIDRLRVTFSAPERLLGQLQKGAPVEVSTTAYADHALQGTIDVIEPQLDPNTRSAGIVAHVDNPERLFRPGMSATISVVLSERARALTIPSEAVFVEGGQAFVYAVKSDSTVTRTVVELGTRLPGAVEIRAGLAADQTVVRTGHQKLYEGAKVMPVSGEGGPPGPEGTAAAGPPTGGGKPGNPAEEPQGETGPAAAADTARTEES
jgi:membrane fusion protein (multidrug efflux system)